MVDGGSLPRPPERSRPLPRTDRSARGHLRFSPAAAGPRTLDVPASGHCPGGGPEARRTVHRSVRVAPGGIGAGCGWRRQEEEVRPVPRHGGRPVAPAPYAENGTGRRVGAGQSHSGFPMRRDGRAGVGRGRFPGAERRNRPDGSARRPLAASGGRFRVVQTTCSVQMRLPCVWVEDRLEWPEDAATLIRRGGQPEMTRRPACPAAHPLPPRCSRPRVRPGASGRRRRQAPPGRRTPRPSSSGFRSDRARCT